MDYFLSEFNLDEFGQNHMLQKSMHSWNLERQRNVFVY